MASSNWKWKPIDIALYACLSNIHVVATKAKYIRVVIVATGGITFFSVQKWGFPIATLPWWINRCVFWMGSNSFKKMCGCLMAFGPNILSTVLKIAGAGNQEMFRVRPKNDHWIIFMVYHPASAVSEWLSFNCILWLVNGVSDVSDSISRFPDFSSQRCRLHHWDPLFLTQELCAHRCRCGRPGVHSIDGNWRQLRATDSNHHNSWRTIPSHQNGTVYTFTNCQLQWN